jgi:hypothetical protein
MTFTIIAAGDPVIASIVMGNLRHVNYGTDLLPVNSSGVSVDNTLNLGSLTKRWASVFGVNGYFSSNFGIGTSSPAKLLELSSSSSPTIRITNTTDFSGGTGTIGVFEFYTPDTSGAGARILSSIECFNDAGSAEPSGLLIFRTAPGGGGGTSATEKMRIDSIGNIGINTSSPSVKLQVHGDAGTAATLTAGTVAALIRSASSGSDALFSVQSGTSALAGIYLGDSAADGVFKLQHDNATNITAFLNSSAGFYLNSSGNMGIGTSSPSGRLHLWSSSAITAYIESTLNGGNANLRFVSKTAGGAAQSWQLGPNQGLTNAYFEIYDITAGATRLTINTSGNFGINTTNPGYKLDINGTFQASGVSTLSGGADLGGTGTTLKCKVVQIGDWDMTGEPIKSVYHGLALGVGYKKIRNVYVTIRDDDDFQYTLLDTGNGASDTTRNGFWNIATNAILLYRLFGGIYDSSAYNQTSYNRGWVYIVYEA